MRHFPLYQFLFLSSILYQLNAQQLNANRMRRQGSPGQIPDVNAKVSTLKAFIPPTYVPFFRQTTSTVPDTTLQIAPQVDPIAVDPTTVEPTTVEPTTVEPTTVEPTTVEPTTVEPTTESTAGEPSTVPVSVTEPTSTLQTSVAYATTLHPPRISSIDTVIQDPTTFATSTEKTDEPTQAFVTDGPPANTKQSVTVAIPQARTGRPTIKLDPTNSPRFTKLNPNPRPGNPPTNGHANGDDGIHFQPLKDEKKRKDDEYKTKVLIYEVATSVVLLATSLVAYIASYLAFKYAKEIRNPQDIWAKIERKSKSKSGEKKEKKAKKGKKAAKK